MLNKLHTSENYEILPAGCIVTLHVLVSVDNVLLCYFACLESPNIFFKPKPTKNPTIWNITAVKRNLVLKYVYSNIIFWM